MWAEKVQRKVDAFIECEVLDAVDLSTDIPWTITEMDNEEESNNVEQGPEPMAKPPKVS